jgi:hypothetical protein
VGFGDEAFGDFPFAGMGIDEDYDMSTYLLDDLVIYIEANSSYVLGDNLFEGLMPQIATTEAPDTAVSLFEYAGEPPDYVYGSSTLPAIAHPRVQILSRSGPGVGSYALARDNCEAIVRILETITNTLVNTTWYERVARLQEPFMMHRDAHRRTFFACNMEVFRTPS